jgi:hypothetical protein
MLFILGLFQYRSSDDDSSGTLLLAWFKSGEQYVYVCVCVCVCERERERESAFVSVCVRGYVCACLIA